MVRIKSYAKINLSLNITGREGGYHTLRSLAASIDLSDTIFLTRRKLSRVTMHGLGSEGIPPEKNNALRAAELFSERFGTDGADISIYKDIPMGAGLGGSSADAAGVLRGMRKLYGVGTDEELKELADALGSDTGYMLKGGYALLEGRGERVTPLPCAETLWLLLLLPREGVSTAECYRLYDEMPDADGGQTEHCVQALLSGRAEELGANLFNSLLAPASRLQPAVARALEEAKSFSPYGAGMTGSGSCVFALFENDAFCEWAKSRYRGACRALTAKTIVPKQTIAWKNPFRLSEEELREAGYTEVRDGRKID